MSEKKTNRRLRWILSTVIVIAVLIGVLSATGVFASLFDTTSVVENQFTPAEMSNEVQSARMRDGNTRYTVSNEGNLPVYVRVKILVNWVDEDGNPMLYAPDGEYQLKMGSGWTQNPKASSPEDGYWYCNEILEPGKETVPLITDISAEGGKAQLVLLSETIQINPEKAVEEAWGMRYADGKWSEAK